jgi:hypothetical protein
LKDRAFSFEIAHPQPERGDGEAPVCHAEGDRAGLQWSIGCKDYASASVNAQVAPISSLRDAAICALYREGETLKAIGARFGLSYEGVRRITAKSGLSKRNAGLAARRAKRPRANTREVACQRTYGCTLRELADATADERSAFRQHRKNARRIGAVWRLSLSEWRAVWRASGKFNDRGQGPSKYGMTRIDFALPIELSNVQIVTNREAVCRARMRGARSDLQRNPPIRPARELHVAV